MNYKDLRRAFERQVYPSEPNDWDIEDALYDLEDIDEEQQSMLLQAIPTVWPISHSLSFSFLKEGAREGRVFTKQTMAEWLRRILDNYEEGGLIKARAYMAGSDIKELSTEKTSEKALLDDLHRRLIAFVRGLSGLDLKLAGSNTIYTDTETLFLPEEIDYFASKALNFSTYKLFIGLQTAFISLGSFGRHSLTTEPYPESADQELADTLFGSFTNSELAAVLYQMLAVHQAMEHLQRDYPGLVRETYRVRSRLYEMRQQRGICSKNGLETIFKSIILPENREKGVSGISEIVIDCNSNSLGARLFHLYERFSHPNGDVEFSFLPFMDSFKFSAAEKKRQERIELNKKKFASHLSDFLLKKNVSESTETSDFPSLTEADSARIQLGDTGKNGSKKSRKPFLAVNNQKLELPEEMQKLVDVITMDMGSIPEGYVSAAFGLSGQGRSVAEGEKVTEIDVSEKFIAYDEWDYRRYGYRKNWCFLRERTLNGARSKFVERALTRHSGALVKIRRQFEMLRTQERFARRRRQGNDLDLDALVDSLGDQNAGLPPSENIFIRLLRNERSISTLFLVDMSNSTEGWIGIAIKEALVLLCEAMEVIGDSYGIYGFSGMRRMRSEVYKIKDVAEKYDSIVKARLAAISPKEYTRMGPPIRHLTQHFRKLESKSRLLLILSDGKPEDYDDYKGQYAIEDTRKALAEARGHGIHPYCITIDKESHDYLEYMFGQGNYTFVRDIDQLPSRMTDIYRLLTR